ncbi:TPA: hypothetical protein DEP96_01380 [Candidatus Uhrbacteria bacterium]|nr:hypothetical protein [Candidatus Uhrbacteria bacterium]
MTTVAATDLNYHRYSLTKYDRDIVNAIPFHRELHERLVSIIEAHFAATKTYNILDLGVGTGLTTKLIKDYLPQSHFDVVDFSDNMLQCAKQRLGPVNVDYFLGDYALLDFTKKYDLITSVIGLHHQDMAGKRILFAKIYNLLEPGGLFILGDLMTHQNPQLNAVATARHYHHLVERATDEQTLTDWAHHHLYLNQLDTLEDQKLWLESAGLKVEVAFQEWHTALLVCRKT